MLGTKVSRSVKSIWKHLLPGYCDAPRQAAALDKSPEGEQQEWLEQARASIRAKVEHPFHVVKNLFHHRKTRYRGLAKNAAQLFSLFGLANLMLARRWLLNPQGQVAS